MVATACRYYECLRFAYRSRDGTDSRREVEPHSLVNLGRRWYLVAWDRRREGWRTFRLDRLTKPASTGMRFTPQKLPAKDAAAYVRQSLTGAADEQTGIRQLVTLVDFCGMVRDIPQLQLRGMSRAVRNCRDVSSVLSVPWGQDAFRPARR